jgi:hypothetical protein
MELLRNLFETLVSCFQALTDLLSPLIGALAQSLGTSLSPDQSRAITTVLLIFCGSWLAGRSVAELLWFRPKPATFAQRTNDLAENLARISHEADALLEEMRSVIKAGDATVKQQESRLAEMAAREQELRIRIETLNKVSIPAVQYFIGFLEKGERRSVWRDIIILIISALLTIVLSPLFLH